MPATASTELLSALNLSPEEKVVIACARLQMTQDQREELQALVSGPLRWDVVVDKARWHRLTGLLFRHLGHEELRGRVPATVVGQLKGPYVANVAKNLYFQTELRRLVVALRAEGIPVILLKGAALVHQFYRDVGLRPMSDLDLLVRHEDADRADSIVRGMGYQPAAGLELQDEMRAQDRQLAALVDVGRLVAVEVHSHIVEVASPLRFDIAGFWERAIEVDINGTIALTLGHEDLLIHLCINFVKDRRFYSYSALGQLCDIAEACRFYADRIDWPRLYREVASGNLRGPVFCGIYLAQQLLNAPVPTPVLRELEPPGCRIEDIERLVRLRVLGDQWVAKELVKPGEPYRWRAIARAVFRRVFPSKRYVANYYKVSLQSKGIYALYIRRLGEALAIAARLAVRPKAVAEDLAVDRWLHSLHGRRTSDNARQGW